MTTLREAAQQALEAFDCPGKAKTADEQAAITALRAALAEPENWELRRLSEELERCKQTCAATSEAWREEAALAEPCPCSDRPAAQCPGEWDPGCDLGNNPKYAKRVEMTPKELAASIKRGEKWKVAEPVQAPHMYPLQSDRMRIDPVTGNVGIGTPSAEPVEPVAWMHTDPDNTFVCFLEWRENEPGYRGDWIKTPLYAAPPQRPAEPVQEPVWVCPDSAEHRYQKPGHCEDCGKTLVQETT